MNIKKRFVLFAINDKDKEKQVEELMTAHKLSFKKVKGSYKGDLEDSYCAVVDEDVKLEIVFHIAAKFNQESILLVNEDRKAFLVDVLTGDETDLGEFVAIDSSKARQLDNWTLDGSQYYAAI